MTGINNYFCADYNDIKMIALFEKITKLCRFLSFCSISPAWRLRHVGFEFAIIIITKEVIDKTMVNQLLFMF